MHSFLRHGVVFFRIKPYGNIPTPQRYVNVAYNFSHFAIYLPKLIKIHGNLTKFWHKQKCTVFFETRCSFFRIKPYGNIPIPPPNGSVDRRMPAGSEKNCDFRFISEMIQDRPIVNWNANRNSYAMFGMVLFATTLNDLLTQNSRTNHYLTLNVPETV